MASPEVDAPDVLLDAGRGAQHLPAVLPDAFEHHLHGVLERGEDGTAGGNEPISGTFGPSTPFPSFLVKAHRTAQRRWTNPMDKPAHRSASCPFLRRRGCPVPNGLTGSAPAVGREWQWGSCLWASGWGTGGSGLPQFPFYLATGGRGYMSSPKTAASGGISRP